MIQRVITLAGSSEHEARIAECLSSAPDIELVLRCVDRVEALAAVRGAALTSIISVGPVPWFDYQCHEEARGHALDLLGLAADPIEAEMLEVAGFRLVEETGLVAELHRDRSSVPDPAGQAPSHGRLIAVWGAKGAPGRSSIAAELAHVFAEGNHDTALVDADLYGGDLAQILGVTDELPSIVTWSRRGARGELRETDLASELPRCCPGGPAFMPGLTRPELWEEVSGFGCRDLIAALKRSFDPLVCDVGFSLSAPGLTELGTTRDDLARAIVSGADHVVAVVRSDPIGLKSFLWALADLDEVLDKDKLVVAANRVRPGEETEVRRILRRYVGRPPLVLVPDRPDHMSEALWAGETVTALKPNSPLCGEIRRLAAALGANVESRGFLSRLAGRSARV